MASGFYLVVDGVDLKRACLGFMALSVDGCNISQKFRVLGLGVGG